MMTQRKVRVSFWVVNPLDIIKEEWRPRCPSALLRPWGVHIFHLSLFSSFCLEAAEQWDEVESHAWDQGCCCVFIDVPLNKTFPPSIRQKLSSSCFFKHLIQLFSIAFKYDCYLSTGECALMSLNPVKYSKTVTIEHNTGAISSHFKLIFLMIDKITKLWL